MTKRQLEKIRKQYEELDFSRWHILGYDELLKINGGSSASSDDDDEEESESLTEDESGKTNDNEASAETASESGGHEIENTVEAVSNAEVGDTLTRDDGTQVTITQEDIDWAQEHCDSGKNKDDEDESPENKSGEEVPEAMPPEEEESSSGSNSADEKDAGDSSRNAETEEEASTSQSQKQSDEEKESSASSENKTLDDDKTDSKETASSSKSENSAAENETKQSSASSSKESSSAPADTTRSAESALPSASSASRTSESEEKSSHGFWDSLKEEFTGFVVSALETAYTILDDILTPLGMDLPSKEEHYNRNDYQKDKMYETRKQAEEKGFKQLADSHGKNAESLDNCHENGRGNPSPSGNDKYILEDEKHSGASYELIYDSNGKLVTDPVNMGTYNFANPSGILGCIEHAILDVAPYLIWGNSEKDPTDIFERTAGTLDLPFGKYDGYVN